MNRHFHRLAVIAAVVAICVIVLGAWVRLSHAGLGCPDWPGCYGQLTWPDAVVEVQSAKQLFPERPLETDKAWKEMVHRYLAGTLVLLVLAINWLVWRRGEQTREFRGLAGFLLGLIIFQTLLGMWTVTWKLFPMIVMGHLLGGMATFSLLLWLAFSSRQAHDFLPGRHLAAMRHLVIMGLAVLLTQIALGGWTSSNYAALACPDLPRCTGQWWPETNFTEGFILWREIGVDYEGGILDQASRTAIHITHRAGAVITLLVLLYAGFRFSRSPGLGRSGALLIALVSVQFALGVMNIALKLPLANAVAHNGMAALLLGILVWLLFRTSPGRIG